VRLVTRARGLPQDDDLCVRAARALQRESGFTGGVDIHLEKHSPMGGGLGGGSSDAATTLIALNALWKLGLSRERKAALALQLGADVPFFLLGHNAFGEGVGEQLSPADLPAAWYVILVPPVSVPTPVAFTAPELTRTTKSVKISSFSEGSGVLEAVAQAPDGGGWPKWEAGFGRNDLEPVVCSRYPEVASHLGWLRQQVSGKARATVRMSGSGACVFAELETENEARLILSSLPGGMRGMVAQGLNCHPLSDM
jgi:4-diphosphocytidyl-2-C-methyl-D-erythritol kinase